MPDLAISQLQERMAQIATDYLCIVNTDDSMNLITEKIAYMNFLTNLLAGTSAIDVSLMDGTELLFIKDVNANLAKNMSVTQLQEYDFSGTVEEPLVTDNFSFQRPGSPDTYHVSTGALVNTLIQKNLTSGLSSEGFSETSVLYVDNGAGGVSTTGALVLGYVQSNLVTGLPTATLEATSEFYTQEAMGTRVATWGDMQSNMNSFVQTNLTAGLSDGSLSDTTDFYIANGIVGEKVGFDVLETSINSFVQANLTVGLTAGGAATTTVFYADNGAGGVATTGLDISNMARTQLYASGNDAPTNADEFAFVRPGMTDTYFTCTGAQISSLVGGDIFDVPPKTLLVNDDEFVIQDSVDSSNKVTTFLELENSLFNGALSALGDADVFMFKRGTSYLTADTPGVRLYVQNTLFTGIPGGAALADANTFIIDQGGVSSTTTALAIRTYIQEQLLLGLSAVTTIQPDDNFLLGTAATTNNTLTFESLQDQFFNNLGSLGTVASDTDFLVNNGADTLATTGSAIQQYVSGNLFTGLGPAGVVDPTDTFIVNTNPGGNAVQTSTMGGIYAASAKYQKDRALVTLPFTTDNLRTIYGIGGTPAGGTLTIGSVDTAVVGNYLYINLEVSVGATDTVTIVEEGGALINGASSYTLTGPYAGIILYSDGTNWHTPFKEDTGASDVTTLPRSNVTLPFTSNNTSTIYGITGTPGNQTFTIGSVDTAVDGRLLFIQLETTIPNSQRVTIVEEGGALINGVTSYELENSYKGAIFYSDGTNWYTAFEPQLILSHGSIVSGNAEENFTLVLVAPSTITLTSADALVDGTMRIIKAPSTASAANPITVDTEGVETIDGQATATITAPYGVLRVVAIGSQWFSM